MDNCEVTRSEIAVQDSIDGEITFSKILKIGPDSKNIDVHSALSQLCQCISLADIQSRIKKGKEYIVQIPTEFQKGFDDGTYWITLQVIEKSKKI